MAVEAASPAAAATAEGSPPADGQPAVSPPVSDTPSGEHTQEAPPAGEGEPGPADDGDALPELADDEAGALFELYGPKFKEHPAYKEAVAREAQALVDRERAEAQQKPSSDPLYQSLQQAFSAQRERYAELVEAARLGEDVDADDLNATLALANEFAEATERRGILFVSDAVLKQELGINGHIDLGDPVQKQYAELVAEHQTMLENVNRLRLSGDPKNRAQAPAADATAAATFIHKALKLGIEHGKRLGAQAERERGNKKTAATIATTKSNTATEAIARAQAVARAARASAAGAGEGTPSAGADLSYAQVQKLKPDEQQKWIDANPEKWDAMIGIKT